jgi:hypothetical protein
MLNNPNFYHGTIRKAIVAFGSLFSNIQIERESKDGTNTVLQTVAVPLGYGPKEKWVVRLDSDPGLNKAVYTTLPRMAFEITGYEYDATRKINRMNKLTCELSTSDRKSMYTPVPYNLEITLYVLTKTQEDALQIIEQILPVFTPEYTMVINAVPEMNVAQDIPVILKSISAQDDYDGDFQTRRFVTHTLNFTLKLNLYGPVSTTGLIKKTTVNITGNPSATYTAVGTLPGNPIIEDWDENF